MNLPVNQKESNPAARYPAPMAQLLTLGKAQDKIDCAAYAADLAAYPNELVQMVLDDELANRKQIDPAS